MFYYTRLRKKGTTDWKAMREDGRILVFKSHDSAKKHTEALTDFTCKIITIPFHPAHKGSPIYGKKYKKIGW